MTSLYLRLAGLAAIALILAIVAGWLYHRGYIAGEAHQEAHYAPILKAADEAASAAQARARASDAASLTISADLEAKHADREKELAGRADMARAAMLGSLRALAAARGRCTVPAVPASRSLTAGTPASPDRDQRFAARLAGVGGKCEHDAAELAAWHDWYARNKALAVSH